MAGQCLWYTDATVTIHFPEGHVCCDLCPMLETYARKQCRMTGEYLLDTRATTGYMCPLKFKDQKSADCFANDEEDEDGEYELI